MCSSYDEDHYSLKCYVSCAVTPIFFLCRSAYVCKRTSDKYLTLPFSVTCRDEELLARGLDLNDGLQSLLAKHDAIVSGLPVPTQATNVSPQPTEKSVSSSKQTEVKDSSASDSSPKPNTNPSAPVGTMTRVQIYEDEEEEDEFAQLARRLRMTGHLSLFSIFLFIGHKNAFLMPALSTTAQWGAVSSPGPF